MIIPLLKRSLGSCEVFFTMHHASISPLSKFRGVAANQQVLLSSEILTSEKTCGELLELGQALCKQIAEKEIQEPMRSVSIQLSLVASEWDLVQEQHRHLLKFSGAHSDKFQVAHLCFPIDFEYYYHDEESVSDFNKKSILQLIKFFNTEALLIYCSWFNQECELLTHQIHFDASEEYQLQALFEDFSHEVHSPLLVDRQQAIAEAMMDEESVHKTENHKELLKLEKIIVSARVLLLSDLKTQNDLLTRMIEGIQKIETLHPEFTLIKQKAVLLNQIIINHLSDEYCSWERLQLMMQLLDEQLGVLPMFCGSNNESINTLLNIRLALIEMRKTHTFEERLKMCLEWDQKNAKEPRIKQELHELKRCNLEALG
ncbi:MAG: hypothetical protein H0X29_05695 [Parachlamydiaceae bacterium]|nr:hypothetical protein [Parachlamydiaceae bacterium]